MMSENLGLNGESFGKSRVPTFSFAIGGVSVGVSGCDDALPLFPSLLPFQIGEVTCDVKIEVKWAPNLRPACARPLFDSGTTWRLFESKDGFLFDFGLPLFQGLPYRRLRIDGRFERAELTINQTIYGQLSSNISPLEYPLDELLIMHRLTQERAIELHSCGIVTADGKGNLFVGHSGAGKSTTTRLWTSLEDVEVLSDDRIIVRAEERSLEHSVKTPLDATVCASEQQVLRLRENCASRISHSAQDDRVNKKTMRMYGTPWHGEAMYASPNSAPLSRIFILEHGHGNILTPLTPSQAVAELFARSFVPFHRHEYVDSALDFLQELAEAVPVYRYSFEPTPQAVDRILDLHD